MRISEHVYAKRIYFHANTPAGVLTRNVFVYLILGDDTSCLIDSGVASSVDDVLGLIAEAGKQETDVSRILLTHAHVDHIGGLSALKKKLGCTVASSAFSSGWVEDIDKEFQERPVPQFYDFVKEPVKVDQILRGGDLVELGNSTLEVYEIPGHEKGQLAYFHREDGVLITADGVPIPGEIPIYDSVSEEVATLKLLQSIGSVQTLLTSWDDVREGPEAAREILQQSLEYVALVHRLTQEGIARFGEDMQQVAKHVHEGLGLPPSTFGPLLFRAVQAHMRERDFVIEV